MSQEITASLSPRAAAARSQFNNIMRQVDKIGMAAAYALTRKIVDALNAPEQQEIQDLISSVGPETPEQARKNACDLLRKNRQRKAALALEGALDSKSAEIAITEAINSDVPTWVRDVLQTRLNAVKAAVRYAPMLGKTSIKVAPKKIEETPRDQFKEFLRRMQQGHWVYNAALFCYRELNGQATTVADLMEQIEQEKKSCWEKCRGSACIHLDSIGHERAADALCKDFDGAEEAIESALDAQKLYGWVKAMLKYRLRQIRETARERSFAASRGEAITMVEGLVGLLTEVTDILKDAANKPVGTQQALLNEARKVYSLADAINISLPSLEDIISGKGAPNNFVVSLLKEKPKLKKRVASAREGEKASALRLELLNSARHELNKLATEIEQRTPVAQPKPEPKKRFRPSLLKPFNDKDDCRNLRPRRK
jgi:hypothetical protein